MDVLTINPTTSAPFNTMLAATDGPSDKQVNLALGLSNAAGDSWTKSELGALSRPEMRKLIDGYKAAGIVPTWSNTKTTNVTASTTKGTAPAGAAKGEWHCFEGRFFLVAVSQSSGKLYAKERQAGGGFAFAAGVIWKLDADTKVNASHIPSIKAYAELHDTCIFCSLPLDLPESTTRGYGEKCASNQGLPWGGKN